MAYTTIADLRKYLGIEETTTFTAAPATEYLTLASVPFVNTLATGTEVVLTSSEAVPDLPAPLAEDTVYYVILVADQIIQLATTSVLAAVPTPIDITDAGTGTHTITRAVADTDLLEDAIEDATDYIDSKLHRSFEAVTTTRYYSRDALDDYNSTILHLDDDLLTITELLNGDASNTEILAATYWLLHRNLGPPYRAIQLTTNDGIYWQWDVDEWVSVTGTWGYTATVKAKIRRAALIMAAYYYKIKDSQVFETTAIPEAGVITIPSGVPVAVTEILESLRKYI